MAVIPTGAIYKSLVFDGEDSRDYGVYITGQAVYNAPERDVEMISIPGRNGSFALDKGRFQNIEVSYPAGIFADNETDFAEAISDFRNLLCSRNGYVRLSDEYHPDEYRMAVYKSGLEVEPAQLKAGEFNIVFDCKPQRYLISGEEAIDVDSGDTILNPTLFESSPMLEVTGYGSINWGAGVIGVNNAAIGDVVVATAKSEMPTYTLNWTMDDSLANEGDPITVLACNIGEQHVTTVSGAVNSYSYTTTNDPTVTTRKTYNSNTNVGTVYFTMKTMPASFNYGTAGSFVSAIDCTCTVSGRGTQTFTATMTLTYDGDKAFTLLFTVTVSSGMNYPMPYDINYFWSGNTILTSSKPSLGNPLYIDLDIGEAYKIEGGQYISINSGIVLPAELPKLASGTNTITFDNTITDLKILPRWWKV